MQRVRFVLATGAVLLVTAVPVLSLDAARKETRVDEAVAQFGLTGKGVIVALIDRGVDWTNNDFRNTDGTTRIAYMFDLNDPAGAKDPNNPYGVGTIYTRAQINAALASKGTLAYRDAVGHGTTSTGIAAGNGRNNAKYRGYAPNATILSIKITGGAPAHGTQPAEDPFYLGDLLPTAINFVRDKAKELGMPAVMLPNVGSQGGPTDGTSSLTRLVDTITGPGIPGLVFVNGTGDDGGGYNRAGGSVPQGQTIDLNINKADANDLTFEMWYPGSDQFAVSFSTPSQSYGPFAAPETGADFRSDINYFQWSDKTGRPYGALNSKRAVQIILNGPAGSYKVSLTGTKVVNGRFDAILNPSAFGPPPRNEFLSFVAPGSLSDGATSQYGIVPTAYINKVSWQILGGGAGTLLPADGNANDIWKGSSQGPTFDGRIGPDVAAPAMQLIATYNPNSYWASLSGTLVADGNGLYGISGAVSAANPQVTGLVALMLEMNPNLDAAAVKYLIQQGARQDSFTGSVPNTIWGFGKLDAMNTLTLESKAQRPAFTANAVVNAATFKAGGVSPGEIITIFGGNLGPAALAGVTLTPLGLASTSVASTEVLFDGVLAPMIYTSSGQISAIVPYRVAANSSTQVQVSFLGKTSDAVAVAVTPTAPGIFAVAGSTQAAALNQDNSVNRASNPAKRGDQIILYMTGEGQTSPNGNDGMLATAVFPKPLAAVTVQIGGLDATVAYAGAAPGLVAGVMQVNAVIPAGAAVGSAVPIAVKVGAVTTGATIAVK